MPIVQAILIILMLVLNLKNESYVNTQIFLGVVFLSVWLYKIEKTLERLYDKL